MNQTTEQQTTKQQFREQAAQDTHINCPKCNSRHTVKAGLKKLKTQTVQRYRCKKCSRYFSDKKLIYKTWPPKIILSAISTYNLGHTLKATGNITARRFKRRIPITTIHSWISEFKPICTFHRLRKPAAKLYSPENQILSRNLSHSQPYQFQLHRAKLLLQAKELPERKFLLLKSHLEKILAKEFPHHIFTISDEVLEKRASQLDMSSLMTAKMITKLQKQNLANKLAELGLLLAKTNRERHQCIQDFMLINDSTTIAAEVPVYLTSDDINYFRKRGFEINFKDYRTPITGHIDILQIRNGLIHILDYKPAAEKVNPVNQLTIYALALASRTKLALKDFKCAWFDQTHYYEFFPLHAVYKLRGSKE